MSLNKPAQMVLASSSKFFIEGIHKILQDRCGLEIVAEASNHEEIKKCFTRLKPDFLLLDHRTSEPDLRKLLDFTTKESPHTKVILLNDQKSEELNASNVIRINKETDSSELIRIIKEELNEGLSKGNNAHRTEQSLTKREMKVAELVTSGLSNGEIAGRLSVSNQTVKSHLTSIFMKLGLQNRYQLIVYKKKLKLRAG